LFTRFEVRQNVADSKNTVDEDSDDVEETSSTGDNDSQGDDTSTGDRSGRSTSTSQVTLTRKGSGAKEAPPFKWKLIGESQGAIITLFKAVERVEVETQHDRARSEGYYSNLRVVDISEKIVQPPSARRLLQVEPPPGKGQPKAIRKRTRRKGAVSKPEKISVAAKPAPKPKKKVVKSARAKKKTAKKTKTAKTRKSGATAKGVKRKTTAAKSRRKASARKK
jgi:hypothetical protein